MTCFFAFTGLLLATIFIQNTSGQSLPPHDANYQDTKHIGTHPTHVSEKIWTLGSTVTLNMNTEFNVKLYCEIERPDGSIIIRRICSDEYKVYKVGREHAGIWIIRYFVKSSMDIKMEKIIVNVIDPPSATKEISAALTKTKDNMIHIVCEVPSKYLIVYCLFTMPNGTMLNIESKFKDEKYEFEKINEEKLNLCNITIRKPSINDNGLWTCSMSLMARHYRHVFESAHLWIDNLMENDVEHSIVHTNNVYVKRGKDFSIKCTTISKLVDYCWFRSPNGTNYLGTKNPSYTANYLSNIDTIVSLNVCEVHIENADEMHVGNWSCRLGIPKDTELEAVATVTITSPYLMPVQKTINVANDEPKLIVNLLQNADNTIRYCRWIRPDGRGLYLRRFYKKYNKYIYSQNETTCNLIVTDWKSEDLGTWSCYARLTPDSKEEIYTTLELVYEQAISSTQLHIPALYGLLLILMIVGSVFFAFLLKGKCGQIKNITPSKNKFELSKQDIFMMKDENITRY